MDLLGLTGINRKSAYLSRLQRGSELKFEVTKVKESLRSVYSHKVDRISPFPGPDRYSTL